MKIDNRKNNPGKSKMPQELKRKMVSIRLSPDMIEFLKTQKNKTQIIEQALNEYKNKCIDI